MYKFSLKFDDDSHSLNAKDGLPLDELVKLLADLSEAISTGDGSKCTLGAIRGNCYALDFFTEEEKLHSNFLIVHRNIEQHSENDLKGKELKYAKSLKAILGGKYYLQVFDNDGLEVVKIKDIDLQKEINHYYLTTTISGVVYELGSKNETISPHIYIAGEDYKIFISKEQDLQLKTYYKTNSLNLRLRQKISSKDNHIISASLLNFEPKNKSLIQSLNELDTTDFGCLKDIESTNDILTKYYGEN